jgi:D-alanyl-D-alanine carboxypeptidase (penicillin-binding protein 5/6)
MTALLLIEHTKPDDLIVGPKEVETIRESSMHMKVGEVVSAHDMLYALMLRSANDGCVAVADHIAGSVPAFVAMMNARAKEIGCTHTHFDNPNGLNDKSHWTCAHDLALIAREAMRYPEFRDAVKTKKYQIHRTINTLDTWMVSKDKWLRKDPSADGIKTGWTIPAGHCFVGSATRDGFRVITVVLASQNWQEDHGRMLDWAFANFEPQSLRGVAISAKDSDGKTVPLTVTRPAYFLRPRSEAAVAPEVSFTPDPSVADSKNLSRIGVHVHAGDIVGTVKVSVPGATFDGTAAATADGGPAVPVLAKVSKGMTMPTVLIGGLLAGSWMAVRRRTRRWLGAGFRF